MSDIPYKPTVADLDARRETALTLVDTALEMLTRGKREHATDCLVGALDVLATTDAERAMIAHRLDTPPSAPTP